MKLTITGLGKQYRREFWGLQDFSLEVQPGILGLLGPTGRANGIVFICVWFYNQVVNQNAFPTSTNSI